MAISSLAVGRWGEALGRRPTYLVLLVIMGVAGSVFALTSFVPLLILAALTGKLSTDANEAGPITTVERAMLAGAQKGERSRVYGRYATWSDRSDPCWPRSRFHLPSGSSRRRLRLTGLDLCFEAIRNNELYEFEADLWLHDGPDPWHFVTVPEDISDDIRIQWAGRSRGFGSVRVKAKIGATEWATSVFPDSGRKAYVLPVRKSVRSAEHLEPGDRITVGLQPE